MAEAHIASMADELANLRSAHALLYPVVESLNLFCRIKFYNYCMSVSSSVVNKQTVRNERSLSNEHILSNFSNDLDKYVLNLSSVTLNKTQKEALSVGLKFCVPPKRCNPINIRAQFENLYDQVKCLEPTSADAVSWFKCRLVDLAHQYERTPIIQSCLLNKEHIRELKSLQRNSQLVILPPDKGSGSVLLNREDYNQKLTTLLSDKTKFEIDKKQKDNVHNVERQINKVLKEIHQEGFIDQTTLKSLSARGSLTPRLYGLPKTHKPGIPLRPVLSMSGSPYHSLAQWLVGLLEPVRAKLCPFSLKDTFEFVDLIESLDTSNKVMTSFDVESLFTNVPLDEVLNIIHDYVLQKNLPIPIPLNYFMKLLRLCTKNIQFLFNGVFYKQVDGVAMGSPLGPILADIFMGHLEDKMSSEIQQLLMYRRYVDDIFAICNDHNHVQHFHEKLLQLHPRIHFTVELEENNAIPFLDVLLVRREDGSLSRGVYRKRTWMGQYLHFKSFAPIKQKRCLVRTLFNRIRRIATFERVKMEEELLTNTLLENGYPLRFIEKYSRQTLPKTPCATAPKKMVYLTLPFKGDNVSLLIKTRLNAAIKRTYNAAELTLVEETIRVPVPPRKDLVPMLAKSNVVYQFDCICGARYIGRTQRHLGMRIKEHLPNWLYASTSRTPASAIARHIMDTGHMVNRETSFKIIFSCKQPNQLFIAEAVAINRLGPILCSQKELVASLSLPW